MTQDRRHSIAVKVGSVIIGGCNPVVVQSMTNTDTADANATDVGDLTAVMQYTAGSHSSTHGYSMGGNNDNFINKSPQNLNQKLCDVRTAFEKYNLISGLHTFMSQKNEIYNNDILLL